MLEALRDELKEQGFGNVAEKLTNYQKQTIRVTTRREKEENFRLGQSKIGGLCHLPPDFGWPVFDGDPLSFIAQINLAELPRCRASSALPDRGVLYFFYADGSEAWGFNLEDQGAAVVHYYDGDLSRLVPTEKAPGETDITVYDTGEVFRFKPCAVTFEAALELPRSPELIDMDQLLDGVEPSKRSEAEDIVINHMYGSDEGDQEDGDDDPPEGEAPVNFGPSAPAEETVARMNEALFGPSAPTSSEEALAKINESLAADPAMAEMHKKLTEHAAAVLRESDLMSRDGEEVPLSGKKGMKAFMKITEMLNFDSNFRNMLGLGDAPAPRGAPEDDGRDPDRDDADYSGRNKMFGWPNLVQGSIFEEAQYVTGGLDMSGRSELDREKAKSLETGIKDWVLLFQMDSDDNADMMWGDLGTLYFVIKKDDLAARRFDRIWFSSQCH